jgi:hypothetical protein
MNANSVRLAILLIACAGVLSACAKSPPTETLQPGSEMSGRWRVIQGEFMSPPRHEKYPILLDTQTGETWHQRWDNDRGLTWHKLTQDR